jgi:hypothetical protein
MWVLNIDSVPGMKLFKCGKLLANWLEKEKGIPILAVDKKGNYCFTDNELLQEVLRTKPFWLGILGFL